MEPRKLLNKIRQKYQQGVLFPVLGLRLKPYIYGLKYLIYNPAAKIKIHCPAFVNPSQDKHEKLIVERIFQAYKLMKAEQAKVSPLYKPSSLWQQQLDSAYCYLSDGLKENDINKFHFFLANFGAWKQAHGIEHSSFIRKNSKSFVRKRYLQNVIFNSQLKFWQWFYNNRKSLSSLTYPRVGNQTGAYIEGVFIGMNSFFDEIYSSMLAELIQDTKRPVIAELGAGSGKSGYFIFRNFADCCYIDFDLPETLSVASYYLMLSCPDKKALLFGENAYTSDCHHEYDLIFMPSWEISKVGKETVTLFLNIASLGEMTKAAVENYIYYMANSTKYLFQMNHDNFPNVYDDNQNGPLGHEYPIPDNFKQLFRYADLVTMLSRGGLSYYMDIFMYLYERK